MPKTCQALAALCGSLCLALLLKNAGVLLVEPVLADATVVTQHSVLPTWQTRLDCFGCNPKNAWQGPGAAPSGRHAVIRDRLQHGDTLQVFGLSGTVYRNHQAISCKTGSGAAATVPQRVPLLQFLDDQETVVPVPGGGFAGTHTVRVMDLERRPVVVPPHAYSVVVSWPDNDYTQNEGLCTFSLVYTRLPYVPDTAEIVPLRRPNARLTTPLKAKQEAEYTLPRLQQIAENVHLRKQARLRRHVPPPPPPTPVSVHPPEAVPVVLPAPRNTRPVAQPAETSPVFSASRIPTPRDRRLICRVQQNLSEHQPTAARTARTIRRLARQTGLPAVVVHELWHTDPLCSSVGQQSTAAEKTARVGRHSPSAAQVQTQPHPATPESLTLHPQEARRRLWTRSRSTNASLTDRSDQAEPVPDDKTKLRILCQLQQRAQREADPNSVLAPLASTLAQRWQLSEATLLNALHEPSLCQKLDPALLVEEPSVQGAKGTWSAFVTRVRELPSLILLVSSGLVGLSMLLILILIILLVRDEV